jgi:hypothetical protein
MKALTFLVAVFPLFASADILVAKNRIAIQPHSTETQLVKSYSLNQDNEKWPKVAMSCFLLHPSSDKPRHISNDSKFEILEVSGPRQKILSREELLRAAIAFGYSGSSEDTAKLSRADVLNLLKSMGATPSVDQVFLVEFQIQSVASKLQFTVNCSSSQPFDLSDVVENFKLRGLMDYDNDSEL